MLIKEITEYLESIAPLSLQEDYDNAGLITGDFSWECTGILCTLDVTEKVIEEAVNKNCNFIIAHHPIIFKGLRKINGRTHVEKALIAAIKKDIAIYASHTNIDNIINGVNGRIADKLGLVNRSILEPKAGILKKLYTFVPLDYLDRVRDALFAAGAGSVGNYSECSFVSQGTGTFLPGPATNPFSGELGKRHKADECKLEVIFPAHLGRNIIQALTGSHPYEEVAYDIVQLANQYQTAGSGLTGYIEPRSETEFLELLQRQFNLEVIKHTAFITLPIKKVAICGGSGSFLISRALAAGADAFVTSDIKYHEFFGAEAQLLLCDIGHYESEQFTIGLFADILLQKFPTFAVLKSEVPTNPVSYFTGK
jgi:dinuclear metal center YbgI/SA1388 family protein